MYNAKKNSSVAAHVAQFFFECFLVCLFLKSFCSVNNIYSRICFVCENIFLNLHSKLCEDRLRSLGNIKKAFMFHSLALSLHCKLCECWLKRYENGKSCVLCCTCGVDYGVVPCSRILQLWISKSTL